MDEEEDRITLAGNGHLIDAQSDAILDNIVDKIEMRYAPAEFQRVAINALGGMKNVILISPTGQSTILNIWIWLIVLLFLVVVQIGLNGHLLVSEISYSMCGISIEWGTFWM